MLAYKFRVGSGVVGSKGESLFERDLETFSNNKIYFPLIGDLNDPCEQLCNDERLFNDIAKVNSLIHHDSLPQVKKAYDNLIEVEKEWGVFSLSKKIDNELMWSYYADGHKGYAVIFDVDTLCRSFECGKNFSDTFKVDVSYTNTMPSISLIGLACGNLEEKLLRSHIGTKSKAWAHEQEVRFVYGQGGKLIPIDCRAIKGFVFGVKMKDKDIDYIMQKFKGRHLSYYQMKLKPNEYKLYKEEIADIYDSVEDYYPNQISYDIDKLFEHDRIFGGVGYKYRDKIKEILEIVSKEPFVTNIDYFISSEKSGKLTVRVWTDIQQEGVLATRRQFIYEVNEFGWIEQYDE